MRPTLILSAFIAFANCLLAQKIQTAPANESRTPAAVRSPNSLNPDLAVPLCPAQFHDSLARTGIADQQEKGITAATIKTTVPALITQQAIDAAGKTHIGNYNVIINVVVDTKGNPHGICLQKSSGYGLDARAANAVQQYHFNAAHKGHEPIKMRLPVEVRFINPNAAFLHRDPMQPSRNGPQLPA